MMFFSFVFLFWSDDLCQYLFCRQVPQSIRIRQFAGIPLEAVDTIEICFGCDTQIEFVRRI